VNVAQTFQLLRNSEAEVVFAGDMNWVDEDQGLMTLPQGWSACKKHLHI